MLDYRYKKKKSLKIVPKRPLNNVPALVRIVKLNVAPGNIQGNLDSGLRPNRWHTIISTNGGIDYRRIYESLGINELNMAPQRVSQIMHKLLLCFVLFFSIIQKFSVDS